MISTDARETILPQNSAEDLKKLSHASVIAVGAGGLGSPALACLAAAGVGHLGIVDFDAVEPCNLNRQFLHHTCDIGRSKAESAKEKLLDLNKNIYITTYPERLTEMNAENLICKYDIVIGAVDSFETRHIINRACVTLGIPYIDGGVNGFNGYAVFTFPPEIPCLNCVFPGVSGKKNMTGVPGFVAGIIGAMQANMAIIRLLGLPVAGRLLLYDGLRSDFDRIEIRRNGDCTVCGNGINGKKR